VKKGRGKSVVVHVDRMRKLPSELESDNSDSQEDNLRSVSQPKQRRKASDAAMTTSTHCTETASCTDRGTSTPLSLPVGACRDHPANACVSFDLDTCNPTVDESQSTQAVDMDTTEAVTARDKPHPAVTKRPVRLHRRPARFLETIQACRLVNRNSAARACRRAARCDVTLSVGL